MLQNLSIKEKSDIIATWISIISAILGGIFAINAYSNDMETRFNDRQLQSIKLLDIYESSDFTRLRTELFQIKEGAVDVGQLSAPSHGSLDHAISIAERKIRREISLQIRNKQLGLDVRRIVDFFDRVEGCVRSRVCDPTLVRLFFKEDAYDYSYILQDFINNVRRNRPTFGNGLLWMRTST